MASRNIINIFIFLFLISPNSVFPKMLGRHDIHIYNDLPDKLSYHCASKDDDFGLQVLNPGQVFTWRFRTNFSRSTLYFCHFFWGSKQKKFDVFQGSWDKDGYYHTYSYTVNTDGFYLSNDPNDRNANSALIFTWD